MAIEGQIISKTFFAQILFKFIKCESTRIIYVSLNKFISVFHFQNVVRGKARLKKRERIFTSRGGL